jgi:NAD(P)H-dependent FMN reductase
LLPNYNAGYSGVVKNGIDALGTVAAGKVVGLIAYCGGYNAARQPIDALMPVLTTLKMNVLESPVLINLAENAFDNAGVLKNAATRSEVNQLLEDIYKAIKN